MLWAVLGSPRVLLCVQVAFVRQRVMQTWGKLVEESCVPLSHWNSLLGQGKHYRLQDPLLDWQLMGINASLLGMASVRVCAPLHIVQPVACWPSAGNIIKLCRRHPSGCLLPLLWRRRGTATLNLISHCNAAAMSDTVAYPVCFLSLRSHWKAGG